MGMGRRISREDPIFIIGGDYYGPSGYVYPTTSTPIFKVIADPQRLKPSNVHKIITKPREGWVSFQGIPVYNQDGGVSRFRPSDKVNTIVLMNDGAIWFSFHKANNPLLKYDRSQQAQFFVALQQLRQPELWSGASNADEETWWWRNRYAVAAVSAVLFGAAITGILIEANSWEKDMKATNMAATTCSLMLGTDHLNVRLGGFQAELNPKAYRFTGHIEGIHSKIAGKIKTDQWGGYPIEPDATLLPPRHTSTQEEDNAKIIRANPAIGDAIEKCMQDFYRPASRPQSSWNYQSGKAQYTIV